MHININKKQLPETQEYTCIYKHAVGGDFLFLCAVKEALIDTLYVNICCIHYPAG